MFRLVFRRHDPPGCPDPLVHPFYHNAPAAWSKPLARVKGWVGLPPLAERFDLGLGGRADRGGCNGASNNAEKGRNSWRGFDCATYAIYVFVVNSFGGCPRGWNQRRFAAVIGINLTFASLSSIKAKSPRGDDAKPWAPCGSPGCRTGENSHTDVWCSNLTFFTSEGSKRRPVTVSPGTVRDNES
jgi:hypothetical protein